MSEREELLLHDNSGFAVSACSPSFILASARSMAVSRFNGIDSSAPFLLFSAKFAIPSSFPSDLCKSNPKTSYKSSSGVLGLGWSGLNNVERGCRRFARFLPPLVRVWGVFVCISALLLVLDLSGSAGPEDTFDTTGVASTSRCTSCVNDFDSNKGCSIPSMLSSSWFVESVVSGVLVSRVHLGAFSWWSLPSGVHGGLRSGKYLDA